MSFITFNELKNLSTEDIKKEILVAKKELFDLRLKKATRQSLKPHIFKHTKRKVAQLLTLISQQTKSIK
jgi:large subunit ribosomal protein L29